MPDVADATQNDAHFWRPYAALAGYICLDFENIWHQVFVGLIERRKARYVISLTHFYAI